MHKKKINITIILMILCLTFTGCFGGLSKEKFLELQNTFYYKLFKPYIYEKIDSSHYRSNIQYKIDQLLTEINISTNGVPYYDCYLSSDGGMYKDTWIFYFEYEGSIYAICWLEVKYNSKYKASNIRTNLYNYGDDVI